jgi:hypothetical protein
MKLSLMAAWATLTVSGSALASPPARTDAAQARCEPVDAEAPRTPLGAPQVNADAPSWLRPGAAEEQGTGGSGREREGQDAFITGEQGLGGSGSPEQGSNSSTDLVSAPPGSTLSGTRGNAGAHFDITPDAWDRNKAIGTDRARLTTGTAPIEGSGGASGR